jgi:hypothetical protein
MTQEEIPWTYKRLHDRESLTFGIWNNLIIVFFIFCKSIPKVFLFLIFFFRELQIIPKDGQEHAYKWESPWGDIEYIIY